MWPVSYIRVPLTLVAIPALSHIQNDPVRYRKYYIKLVSLVALVSMPLMVFLAICSDNVTRILLGQKWAGAGIIVKIMAITGFIIAIGGTRGLVQVSLGKSGRYFKWGLYNGIATVISFIVGLSWGAVGIAASYAIVSYLIFLPSLWYCFRFTPITVITFLRAIWQAVIAGLCMAAAIYPCYLFLTHYPDIVVAGLCFVTGLLIYILVIFLMPGGLPILQEFCRSLALILPKKSKCSELRDLA